MDTEYKSNGDRNKNLSLDEYFDKTRPYLRDLVIDLQEFHTWKIQLTVASKGAKEERLIHSNSDNTKFTFYNDANKVVVELFKSFCSIYQGN